MSVLKLVESDDSKSRDHNYDSQSIIEYLIDEKEKCERDLDFSWLSAATVPTAFKLLLIFPRYDHQCESLAKVARNLGWSVTETINAEDTLDRIHFDEHDLVIIDRRGAGVVRVADDICRLLIQNRVAKHFRIIAMVKRTFFIAPGKDDMAVLELLNLGYNRAIMECSHEGILMNELIGAQQTQIPPKNQLSAGQLMFLTFEYNWMITLITSSSHKILFANRASERLTYEPEEMINQKIDKYISDPEMSNIKLKVSQKNNFKGNVPWKKKENGLFKLNLMVIPLNLTANKCVYYAYFFDPVFSEKNPDKVTEQRRRASVLNDLPLEAPIAKIITLLSSALNHTDDYSVNAQIESALRYLKYIDLAAPHVTEEDEAIDPNVENILETIVSANDYNGRHSALSSTRDSEIMKILEEPKSDVDPTLTKEPLGPPELEELLETVFNWDFDIFKLEIITDRRPLYYAGTVLMGHYRVAERLHCDEQTLRNWLTVMEANYSTHVNYHNSTHATDVMQALARFMRSERLKLLLDPLDEVAALIAAAAHDVGHPGKSSQFLCNGNHKLALLYNDLTVLESHHSALTFKLTLGDEKVNIFKNLNKELYRFMRTNIIDMILATEMTKHFEHLVKFVNVCNTRISFEDDLVEIYTGDAINTNVFLIPENLTMTKRMIIKCADVSNPTRSMREYVEWTRRIAIEYFDQTDEEKSRKWPVMMPMFDRATCSIPKSQIGFVDYIIHDMMEAWDAFIDMPELVGNMNQNYENWKTYDAGGIHSLEDIAMIQETLPELQLYKKPDKNGDPTKISEKFWKIS